LASLHPWVVFIFSMAAINYSIICSIFVVWWYNNPMQSPIQPLLTPLSHEGVTIDGVLDWRLDIDHFNIRLVTTLNYSAIADLHTLQITIAVCCSSSVVPRLTASNSGDSSASELTSLSAGSQLHRLSLFFTDCLTTA
jgi:hypothetical protein